MSEPLALYLPETVLPGRKVWARIAPGARVRISNKPSAAAPTVSLVFAEGTLSVHCMPPGQMPTHRSRFTRFAERNGASESLVQRLQAVSMVIAVEVTESFDDEKASEIIARLQAHLHALKYDGDQVIDEAGDPLLDLTVARDDLPEPELPDPLRVLERAQILAAVAARGLLEYEPGDDAEEQRTEISGWIVHRDLDHELEPEERRLLDTPVGSLDEQEAIDATWRMEGLAVLVWSMGGAQVPLPDELATPEEMFEAIGFLSDQVSVPEPIRLRQGRVLEEMGRVLLGLHWRFRTESEVPGEVDMKAFSRDNWFGGFSLEGLELIGGDLGVMGVALTEADREDVGRCHSAAQERHQAINWLLGDEPEYSSVDTPT